jgi:hypothetical protein
MEPNEPRDEDLFGFADEYPLDPGDEDPLGLRNWLGTDAPWNPMNNFTTSLPQPSPTSSGFQDYRESNDVLHPDEAESNMGGDSGYGSVMRHHNSVQGDSSIVRSRMSDFESVVDRSYIEQPGPSNPLASTIPKVSSDSGHTIPGPSGPSFICPECNMMFRRPSELKLVSSLLSQVCKLLVKMWLIWF